MYHSPPVAAKDGGFAGALKRKAHGASPLSAHTVAPAGGGCPSLPEALVLSEDCLRQILSGSSQSRGCPPTQQSWVAPEQQVLLGGHHMHSPDRG